jgi:hypothetical protein
VDRARERDERRSADASGILDVCHTQVASAPAKSLSSPAATTPAPPHARVARWVATLGPDHALATSSITELGFVRIAPQARLSPHAAAARELLAQLCASTRPPFVRIADDVGADSLPSLIPS